jgi:hypothetical protein
MTITLIEMRHLELAADYYAHAPRANDLYVAAALNGLLANPQIVVTLTQARTNRKKLVDMAIELGREVMNRRKPGNNVDD